MNLILFDDPAIRTNLLPLTFTRPIADIRIGIVTIREKWEKHLQCSPSYLTESYLQKKYPVTPGTDNLLINGALCPDDTLLLAINSLKPNQTLIQGNTVLAARRSSVCIPEKENTVPHTEPCTLIDNPWKIFQKNAEQIRLDFALLTAGRKSADIQDPYTRVYGKENLFIEDGVELKAAILNAERGPIYLGKNSAIQEGSVVRGAFALCEGSIINMGAKMRGDCTIGPYCKVGGEISNSVLFGYSNKSHDGFLGNSVLSEWCNLGADTNTSNMKNNYDDVKLWSYTKKGFVNTGLQFCGLVMGDHSKCGINTMFNTGTVVGVSANVFGDGYPRNFIPSFSWGGASGFVPYQLKKALETAERAMSRRQITLTPEDIEIMTWIFDNTEEIKKHTS